MVHKIVDPHLCTIMIHKLIAVATDEQQQTYKSMNMQISDVDQVSSSVQEGAKELFAVSEEVQEVTAKLNRVITQYKV